MKSRRASNPSGGGVLCHRIALWAVFGWLIGCGSPGGSDGITGPAPALRLETVATDLFSPVSLVSPAGDPRLFIVEQTGLIRIVQSGQLLAKPFLDVSNRISGPETGYERGLLSLAFHPQYIANGFFFIFYTAPNGAVTVERLRVSADPNVATPTGTVVLSIPHDDISHNGGALVFGPDGLLYIGVGDGGCCRDPLGAGQSTETLLGKLLRIDVRSLPYSIPAGNPFTGRVGARPEIWAYGLRNPWRIDFDIRTNFLYIADVGEDTYEEVDVVPRGLAGANLGWNVMEGAHCLNGSGCSRSGFVLPVLEYPHPEGCSITGGFVYRGREIPELAGEYFYSDYCGPWLKSFLFAGGAATRQHDWGISVRANSFGKDANGELYVLTPTGTVYKIVRE